jgi:hypothetical protein
MLEPRSQLNLAAEPVDVDSCCKIRGKNFYDDLAIELGIGGDEHARHARAAELAIDSIRCSDNFLKVVLEVGIHESNMGKIVEASHTELRNCN